MSGFVTGSEFNRFVNLDNVEWGILNFLAQSDSKYANYLWKILKYSTEDCLTQPDVSYADRIALIYTNNGEASGYRAFMTPFTDDSWEDQAAMLHVYVESIKPTNHLVSNVQIAFECIVHNKISNILGDASKFNPETNPVELDGAKILCPYKSRATTLLKSTIAALNGNFVNGVGVLQFNSQIKNVTEDAARASLWNGKKFFGFKFTMSTIMSGNSTTADCGW